MLRRFLFGARSFTNEITILATPEATIALLHRPQDWFRLQPLVIGVEAEPNTPGYYQVTDRLTTFGRSYELRYRVHVVTVSDGIESEAWSPGGVHVVNALRAEPAPEGTLLRETCRITAPRPLVDYAARTAEAAHRALLGRLRDAVVAAP